MIKIIRDNSNFNTDLGKAYSELDDIDNDTNLRKILKNNLEEKSKSATLNWINGTGKALLNNSFASINDRNENLNEMIKLNTFINDRSNALDDESKKYYDKRICEEWKRLKEMNNKVDLNTKIIEINNNQSMNYDFYLSILKATIIGCVMYVLFFIIFMITKDTSFLKYGLIFVIIYIILYVFYLNATDKSKKIKTNITSLTEETTRGLVRATAINLLPKDYYKCPNKCKIKRDKLPEWKESNIKRNNLDEYCSIMD
jgi:hypothetical protein